jgi:transposase-like protein
MSNHSSKAHQQERIATALETIAKCLLKQMGEIKTDIVPVAVRASSGSCPDCDSTSVEAHGIYPHNIYVCRDCSFSWVSENSLK